MSAAFFLLVGAVSIVSLALSMLIVWLALLSPRTPTPTRAEIIGGCALFAAFSTAAVTHLINLLARLL